MNVEILQIRINRKKEEIQRLQREILMEEQQIREINEKRKEGNHLNKNCHLWECCWDNCKCYCDENCKHFETTEQYEKRMNQTAAEYFTINKTNF